MTSAERVSRNFIKRRGMGAFRRLVSLLEQNASGPQVASEFGVSRERVRQWKNALGTSVSFYRLFPEIQQLALTPDKGGENE